MYISSERTRLDFEIILPFCLREITNLQVRFCQDMSETELDLYDGSFQSIALEYSVVNYCVS